MSAIPLSVSLDSIESAILDLWDLVRALDTRLTRMESANRSQPPRGASVATASMAATPTSVPAPPTKGKGRAKAAPPPSKAMPAKKGKPTKKKPAIPSNSLPLHLAQTFPQEGKPDCHLVTVAIPNAAAAHVVGQGGKGLKQISNISGARISAYVLAEGSRKEHHVSIRGTNEQVGDALVVLGKRIARKHVHNSKPKKTVSSPALPPPARGGASAGPSASFPTPPLTPVISLQPPTPRYDPPTPVARTPSGGWGASATPPSVQMASPSPLSTAFAPTVAMGSPSPSGSATPSSPMQIGVTRTASGSSGPPHYQTARQGGGPPKGS